MAVLGPSEAAACVPPMLSSLAVALAAAWLVGWPRRSGWIPTSTMLLVSVIPAEVAFASYPAAPQIAAGLLALGAAFVLKGGRSALSIGPVLLALGFMTHEVSLFFIALFFLVGVLVDRRRFLRPGLATAVLSVGALALEALAYDLVLGDWLARWHTASAEVDRTCLDPRRFGNDVVGFFLWPVRVLFLSKHFGPDLLLVFALGALWWRRLDSTRRVLLGTAFLLWLWLGYGSQVPWAYRPRTRSFHYYLPLVMPVAVLLPGLLAEAVRSRGRSFGRAMVAILAVHILSLAAGGRWGQCVEVSRHLLDFARAHPDSVFVADIHTSNEMLCLNGFRQPTNVTHMPSELASAKLLAARGRPPDRLARPSHHLATRRGEMSGSADAAEPVVDYILVNHEDAGGRPDLAFDAFLASNRGAAVWRLAPRTKILFRPLVGLLGSRPFFTLNRGGEVVRATPATRPARPPG